SWSAGTDGRWRAGTDGWRCPGPAVVLPWPQRRGPRVGAGGYGVAVRDAAARRSTGSAPPAREVRAALRREPAMTMPTLSTPTHATPTHAGPASTARPGGATSCRGPSVPAPRTPAEAGGPAPTGAGRDLAAAARSPTAAQLRAQAGALRALGWSYRRIAQHWQRGYRLNARLAFRLARGWTQDEAARQWNARWPANLKTSKAFSYWESWPAPGGRAPSPDVLQRLAELYLCRPGDLLDGVDYGALDPGRDGPAEPRGHR